MKGLGVYATKDGKEPYTKWFSGLKDKAAAVKIAARLDRLLLGNYGDCKSIGQGIFELRINFGPGYRIYYAEIKSVLLLLGGDKGTQKKDIKKAKEYWEDFKVRKK